MEVVVYFVLFIFEVVFCVEKLKKKLIYVSDK